MINTKLSERVGALQTMATDGLVALTELENRFTDPRVKHWVRLARNKFDDALSMLRSKNPTSLTLHNAATMLQWGLTELKKREKTFHDYGPDAVLMP